MYTNWTIEGYDYRRKTLNDMTTARYYLNEALRLLDKSEVISPDIILIHVANAQDALSAVEELCHEVIELTDMNEDDIEGVKLEPLSAQHLMNILP